MYDFVRNCYPVLPSEGMILYSHIPTVFLPLYIYILVLLKTYILYLFLAAILEIKAILNLVLGSGKNSELFY